MSRQTLVVLAVVVVAGLAGAYGLGVFSPEVRPAGGGAAVPAAEPVAVIPSTPSTPSTTPAPAAAAPARGTPAAAATPEVPAPAAPTTATLRIDSDVPGAQVFIDNKFVGTAPATAEGVQPGQRKINVQAPGYESVAEFHDIAPGARDISISLKTIRLDQTIAVTHKHRLGSCSGTLVATPEGIRYETANREDGFAVGLLDLETFEADFLQKNLKLKIRGGKSYDFTDPTGKAEALYLFHQEVEKVRKRLKGTPQ